MLKFKNLSEEQIEKVGLIPEGKYRFKIINAEPSVSKNNYPQILLNVCVSGENIIPTVLKSYLSTNGKLMLRLLRHFCHATGLQEKYESGQLEPIDCLNKEGHCEIDIHPGKEKFDLNGKPDGKWNDKNIIVDWVESKEDSFKDDIISF